MKILVIGGSSLLAKYLALTKPTDIQVEYTWFSNIIESVTLYHLDICIKSQVLYVLERVKPDLIIHCAAQGSVDYAESHFNETHFINVIGLQNVLDCEIPVVYISSNAVFSGDDPPYSEVSECKPINAYGKIKREAELRVMATENWMIIRPFLLYGYPYLGGRQNWLTTILTKLEQGQVVRLVNDTYWQPTSALDCASAIWSIVAWGGLNEVYHVASSETVTLYQFGKKIAELWGYSPDMILPISSDELKIAPRPKDTTFDLSKIKGMGIKLMGIEEGLKALK